MRQALICGLLTIWLCSCETFPQLDAMITEELENADYPKLLPSSQLKAMDSGDRLTELNQDDLVARAERLQKRGEALRNQATSGN